MAAPPMMSAPHMCDVSREIAEINSAVDDGVMGEDLEAGFQALGTLAQRLGGALESYVTTSEYIDFVAVNQPLSSLTCINLPADTVAQACGCPAIADAVAKVYPGLILEPHPSLRSNEYRLKRG